MNFEKVGIYPQYNNPVKHDCLFMIYDQVLNMNTKGFRIKFTIIINNNNIKR